MEPRLQRRYQQLVQEQAAPVSAVAAGLRALPGERQAAASMQAAFRFYNNERIPLTQLSQPLLEHAREAVADSCKSFALVMHDWSHLHFNDHASKQDRIPLSQRTDLGYNLQSALLVSDRTGAPLTPVHFGLEAADGVHLSSSDVVEPPMSPLDGLAPVMAFVERLAWQRQAVHIIDAEADSIGHYRHWHEAGYLFLVRADACNHAHYEGKSQSLEAIGTALKPSMTFTRDIEYHGKPARQFVAEATVTIKRPAKLRRHGQDGPRTIVPGPPLTLRLIVAEVRDTDGAVLACWYLLSNLPSCVIAEIAALWYYWRWRIESYFKLLKGAGHQLEHWQQETALALARRLLVTSMACVLVWRLARSQEPEAEQVRAILIRLSGRQMKHKKPFTEPALLAGLWVFLAMQDFLERFDPHDIRCLIDKILPKTAPQPYIEKPQGPLLV
jgi:hypothetical protein